MNAERSGRKWQKSVEGSVKWVRTCDLIVSFVTSACQNLTMHPVTTAVLPNIRFCWNVTPRRWLSSFRRFGGSGCVQLQGIAVKEDSMAVRMEALRSFETPGATHPTTRRHIPEDAILRVKQQLACQFIYFSFLLYCILYFLINC